ncbi:methyltransferase domain-containing protein [Roseinatronobacter alkalisoli]|uniref:SAM-dependent methyltransferase n=1 Tax=Roseinatronobacter alkalisoli TaxID=3028235 RepID=A0ABT5T8K4_9RHOB|nr:methyltransferase domain-containing protein [Roseinatronobacter sp. HJB301]MDD7970696.1 SAM-dependent methyltransferase [Roseinatronobacter sp. HJB301]
MTRTPPELTDRAALLRNRARVNDTRQPPFLHQIAQEEFQFRLSMVNRSFNSPAIVTGLPQLWADFLPDARVVADDPVLDLQEGAHDLVVHVMALHWSSDPVGQLVQARRALRPDGLFLGVLLGGQTLKELRSALAQAESDLTGGLSPRVLPMAEIRDLGALLQRAGLALPVADSLTQSVAYGTIQRLFDDLRAMGERNALAARRRSFTPPALFRRTEQTYAAHYSDNAGRIMATFELIFLTGWAPDASQPRPLRPGSAKVALADALGSVETPLPDQVKIPGND